MCWLPSGKAAKRRGNKKAPLRAAATNVTRGASTNLPAEGRGLRRGAVLLLEPQLAGRLASAPRRFLARQVADAKVPRVHEQAPAVDQDLGLARSGFDHGRALENGGHPDAATIVDLGLEVGQDLVVLVHRDVVEADELSACLFSALAVASHAHIPLTR